MTADRTEARAGGRRRAAVSTLAVTALGGAACLAGTASAGTTVAATTTPKPDTITLLAGGPGSGRAHNVAQRATGLVANADGTVDVADGQGYLRSLTDSSRTESYLGGGPAGSTASGVRPIAAYFGRGKDSVAIAKDAPGDLVIAANATNIVSLLSKTAGTRYGITMKADRVYTLAGDGGGSGTVASGALATSVPLSDPDAVAVDGAGDIVIADNGANDVEVVPATTGMHFGQQMTVGHIYTVAGTGSNGTSTSGQVATSDALDVPDALAVTPRGIAIANSGDGQIDVLATNPGREYGTAMPTAGDIYVVGDTAGETGTSPDGTSGAASEFSDPTGLAVDAKDDLYIADSGNADVRVLSDRTGVVFGQATTSGDVYTVAGTGVNGTTGNNGPATSAELDGVAAVAIDRTGNLLIGDQSSDFTTGGNVDLVAGAAGDAYGQTLQADHLYIIAGDGLAGSSGYAAPAVESEDAAPSFISAAPDGDVAFADSGNFFLEAPRHDDSVKPDTSGKDGPGQLASRVRVVAAADETRFGITMQKGDIYTVAGGNVPSGPPTGGLGIRYGLLGVVGAAYDHAGNLVVTDDQYSEVDVLAARTGHYYGIDMVAGHLYVVAGGGDGAPVSGTPATSGSIGGASQAAVDKSGNVVLASETYGEVDVIATSTGTYYGQPMTAGDLYIIAGDGSQGDAGDGGPAPAATLDDPSGLAVDAAGDVAVTSRYVDSDQSTVRLIAATSGTSFGQHVTAGDIYTIAGADTTPVSGFGNGGPAAGATLSGYVNGLAFTADGSLVLADTDDDGQIRLVAAGDGTRFGIAMAADHIYAVAGTTSYGRTGYPGLATATPAEESFGVAITATGNLLFTDRFQNIVSQVTDR